MDEVDSAAEYRDNAPSAGCPAGRMKQHSSGRAAGDTQEDGR